MPEFHGSMPVPGQVGSVLRVTLEVEGGRLALHAGQERIGEWPLTRMDVEFDPDGVHLVVEGEDLFVVLTDQEGFAEAVRPYTEPPEEGWWRSLFRRRAPRPEEPPAASSAPPAAETTRPAPEPPVEAPDPFQPSAPIEPARDPFEPAAPVVEAAPAPPEPAPRPVRVEEPVAEAGQQQPEEPLEEPPPSWIPAGASSVPRLASTGLSSRRRPILLAAAVLVVLGVVAPGLLALLMMIVGGVAVLAGVVAASDPILGSRYPPALSVPLLLGAGVGAILISVLVTLLT